MSQYFDLKKQIDSVKEKMSEIGESFFAKKFNDIFKKYPNLKEVSWNAYTPYFNDGEPCTFNSNHKYAGISFFKKNKENEKAETEIEEFLSQFDDDLMLAFFDEEVSIKINNEGIEITECNHD